MEKTKLESRPSPAWNQKQYEVVTTQDGSPSLRSLHSQNQEIMHHSGGAWAETEFIYGKPLQKAFQFKQAHSVASVGLGLGYNELLATKIFIESKSQDPFQLYSFERDSFLSGSFLKFILGESLDPEIESVYSLVLSFVSGKNNELEIKIKTKLKQMYEIKTWHLLGNLEDFNFKTENNFSPFNVILYDAFSSKTSPELWQEEFLARFFQDTTATDCVISTYACTGSLKRAVKKNNFQYIERVGFMGKRNSSLAVRGFSPSPSGWTEIC